MENEVVFISDEIRHQPVSRVLTGLEIQLFSYLGSERQAIAMAPYAMLSENANSKEIEVEVTRIMAALLEAKNGDTEIEYLGGQRRDTLRA